MPVTCVVEGHELRMVELPDSSNPLPWEVAEAVGGRQLRLTEKLDWHECEQLPVVDPAIVLGAEDNFATQHCSRKTGLAALRPEAIEPFRRSDPAEDVWILPRDPRSIAGPGQTLQRPAGSNRLDAGVALAAIADSRGDVAGYCVALDVVRRDVPVEHSYLARSHATHTPVGSVLCTPDELGDPHTATLTSSVDDRQRQCARLSEMAVQAPVLFESIRHRCHLGGGDLVLLGTPGGTAHDVGEGWLEGGNVVQGEITRIGVIEVVVEDQN
jgi:hypothetical protein